MEDRLDSPLAITFSKLDKTICNKNNFLANKFGQEKFEGCCKNALCKLMHLSKYPSEFTSLSSEK